MAKPALSETITGTCKWCGDKRVEIFRDNRLCEDCDNRTHPCSVCGTIEHEDSHCRHVFQDRNFEWMGAGAFVPTGYVLEQFKPHFFKLLELMPVGFAEDLRTAIKSGGFYTWSVAPLIGGGGILELHAMPDRDGKSMFLAWGDALIEIGGGEHAEYTADGYRWLVSLYKGKTLEANKATTTWLGEFLKSQKAKP